MWIKTMFSTSALIYLQAMNIRPWIEKKSCDVQLPLVIVSDTLSAEAATLLKHIQYFSPLKELEMGAAMANKLIPEPLQPDEVYFLLLNKKARAFSLKELLESSKAKKDLYLYLMQH